MGRRILAIDCESTGRDVKVDRATEIGAILYDVDIKKPLLTYGCLVYDVLDKTFPTITAEINNITGITQEMLNEFGKPAHAVLKNLNRIVSEHKPEYLVAHNGYSFDFPLLEAELNRVSLNFCQELREIKRLDTLLDINYPKMGSRKLDHIAAAHKFVNPFSHRALFDCLTMVEIISRYDFDAILKYKEIPWTYVRAMVGYDDRQKAKDANFKWQEINGRTFPKMWVRLIKVTELEELRKTSDFTIVELE